MGDTYELAIIGGGPAGAAAGVYAARKQMHSILIAERFGGQSVDSLDVQNWIGTSHISGFDLAKALEKHVREYANDFVTIKTGTRVRSIETTRNAFTIQTVDGSFSAKTVLIASGGARKKLEVPGAKEFENKGVVYCASCDGPLFAGMDVAVVGGGNAGLESTAQLMAYAKSVTLIHRRSELKGDPVTAQKVFEHSNVHVLFDTEPVAIKGSTLVETITVHNIKSNVTSELPVSGVFVEIGMLPATDFVRDLVALDEIGRVKTDPKNQRTSVDGVWAAGDCTDELYHQNNIAAGDAVKALEDIYLFLRRQ